jgi:hypothetical protein
MAKERLSEEYGDIRYTIGTGCSGGSITQQQVANAYPNAVYDGLVVTCAYPDDLSTGAQFADLHLLRLYFEPSESGPPLWADGVVWTPEQMAAVEGHVTHANAITTDELFFKSVTEPTGTNVTGFFTVPPVKRNFDIFLAIKPGLKTVGTIWNSGETNSKALDALAKAEAEKRGIKWVTVTVTSSAEIKNAAESLVGKVDAIVTPQDNTVASAYEALIKVARDAKIPWFSLDVLAVERGAIAAVAQHQYQNGVDWAKKVAVPVLLGKDPGTIVPVEAEVFEVRVNTAAAKAFGLTIPEAIVKSASKVFDK